MNKLDQLFNIKPYSLKKDEKKIFLDEILFQLTKYHFNHCYEYKCLVKSIDFKLDSPSPYSNIPFLPVRLFKMYDLLSINKDLIFK